MTVRLRTVPAGHRSLMALLVAAVLVAGCSLQTATAPTGSTTLYAAFDDAQDLTAGHKVQISGVPAGSVRDVTLDGYRARVRMSIVDGRRIPEGTVAVIRRTSLLGEHFVDLVFPAEVDLEDGSFLASGDEIDVTDSQPDIEQLAQQASAIVGSLTVDDVAASVQAGAEALGGRGAVLNQAISDASSVVRVLADQHADLGDAIDGLASLGSTLAPVADRLGPVIDELNAATEEIAGSRDAAVRTVESLVALAQATNEVVLEPHAERLRAMLEQVRPILATLADRTDVLAGLIVNLLRFTEALPLAVHDGTVLLLAWAFVQVPGTDIGLIPGLAPDPIAALLETVGGAA